MSEALLKLESITKTYHQSATAIHVLKEVSLSMQAGESISIMGPSGSGKSTLLHIIGSLDHASSGMLVIDGRQPLSLPEDELARFRNEMIGFVFQDHHLLPQYTVLENVLLPSHAFKDSPDRTERAHALLDSVGLTQRIAHRPSQLSGGERQRVAIARALINQPSILLCDEPTGNLDDQTAASVADLLLELHIRERNVLIVVTHSARLARRCGRSHLLSGGLLEPT